MAVKTALAFLSNRAEPGADAAPVSLKGLAFVCLLALLPALYVQWDFAAKPPPGNHVSGFFQGDMPTYVCYARMGEPRTLGLTYQNAHDIREEGVTPLVNLPISVMGWLLKAGMGPVVLEHAMRIVFGFTMFFVLGLLLRVVFPDRKWFWLGFLVTSIGGGFTWWTAFGDMPDGTLNQFSWVLMRTRMLQQTHYWWFLDLYRNLWYPLELAYHTMLFGQLYGLATRRWRLACVCHALGCLSNPFLGIQMSGIQLPVLLWAFLWTRERPKKRFLAISFTVAALFVSYYALLLPLDDVARSLEDQHRFAYRHNLEGWVMQIEYGPALIGLIGLVVDRGFRRMIRDQWTLVPPLMLALVTLALSQHGRLGFGTLMPMHFTRGYLHTGLWILTLAWGVRLAMLWKFKQVVVAAAFGAVLMSLPGTLFFLRWEQLHGPQAQGVIWPHDYQEVLDELEAVEEPQNVVVHDWELGRQICALTWHRSAFGTELTTPHYAARVDDLRQYARSGVEPELIAWADVVIVRPSQGELRRRLEVAEAWESWFENRTWKMFRRTTTP